MLPMIHLALCCHLASPRLSAGRWILKGWISASDSTHNEAGKTWPTGFIPILLDLELDTSKQGSNYCLMSLEMLRRGEVLSLWRFTRLAPNAAESLVLGTDTLLIKCILYFALAEKISSFGPQYITPA